MADANPCHRQEKITAREISLSGYFHPVERRQAAY
jgi:hypothetical protein